MYEWRSVLIFLFRFVKWSLSLMILVLLFCGMALQFAWHLLLGEEPVIRSTDEMIPILILTAILGGLMWGYIWLHRNHYWIQACIWIGSSLFTGLWLLGVISALFTHPLSHLAGVRYAGLLTTAVVTVYSFRMLFMNHNRSIE